MKNFLLPFMVMMSLCASDELQLSAMDDFEKTLMEGLDEVSDLATKSKLNIDDTPAFMTILYSENFQEYGIDTVYEALSLVPGVELTIESTGAKTVIFRGGREKGKIKLLVDGIAVNNAYRGSMYHYLNFPVELVDRIEVIRGPGSVLYGSNAINGVINIVTKNQNTIKSMSVFGSSATYGQNKAGFSHVDTLGDMTLSLDGYYQTGDKAIDSGPDKSGYEDKTDEALKDYSVGLLCQNGFWKFTARTKNSNEGFAYGPGNYLERKDDLNGLVNKTDTAELLYQRPLGSSDLTAKIGYKDYRQDFETRYLPDSIVSFYPKYGGAGVGDLIYKAVYQEEGNYLDISLNSTPVDKHNLITGIYADRTDVTRNKLNSYREFDPATKYIGDHLLEEKERTVTALYLQDSFTASDAMDITAGVRWDSYSDYGSSVSPRFAAVYRLDEKRNLKAMYSRAFRAPSWVELYADLANFSIGNPDLKAETSDTFEVGLVSKEDIDNLIRFNLFYTNINDVIYRRGTNYVQDGTSHFYGGELEYRERIALYTTLTVTLSETEGLDKDDEAIADIANQTAGLRISHKFKNRIVSGTNVQYVSTRKRITSDTRDDLAGYTTVNQTFSYHYANGMALSFTAKNLTDADVVYPAAPNSYPDDYPREGRTFWIKASWEI